MGYGVWFISSHFHPEHTYNEEEWYGFAQFKEQHLFAAILGLIATVLSIAGFFAPVLLLPAAWLFVASNLMWATSEYHKLNNPHPKDENYSHSYQEAYSSYATTLAAISVATALSATLIFLFPPLTIPILVVSAITIAGLSILVAEIWLNYTCDNHPPTPVPSTSHDQMVKSLGPKNELEEINSPRPYHGKGPLHAHEEPKTYQLELDDVPLSKQQTCSMTL